MIPVRKAIPTIEKTLGSTVAVTDGVGSLVQTTGYYPSGTPYKLPSEAGTDLDAVTEKLHIGNKWIGHKGFDLYDNTARMHDPLLARFHSVDPLFGNYPGSSPWTHCLANPLNYVDPDGRDNYQLNENGTFELLERTEDKFDVIKGRNDATLQVDKEFMESAQFFKGREKIHGDVDFEERIVYDVTIYKIQNDGAKVFEFLADNSNVEWSRFKLTSGYNYIGTSHDTGADGSVIVFKEHFPEEFKDIYRFDHNHPNNFSSPSPGDYNSTKEFSDNRHPVLFRTYTTAERYHPPSWFIPWEFRHYRYYYPE